ncbi:PREDICTED: esterase E4-like isoform X2 [Polistes dominula]|uniref:Carboxylic ester hydrolase n=1 Tax=Polistes dominula TaxID=743375 RepID=A0ABM1IDS0_POLDO|nr:PREDICTED: esterase E4-like isoform X2 [Polistes dominula]
MSIIVNVRQGQLKGYLCESVLGTSYYSFKGIPFAAPPLGPLRFKDPEPPASWTGVRDAGNVEVNFCVQLNEMLPNNIIGSEDSLYLNVYTNSFTDNKAVIVFIHGGGFVQGSGTDKFNKPDYFMNKNIVFVTINYRLGVLGFFNLDDEVAAGNQGLKDQVAALKWVQENISHFGGNANNVTIFGNSAGAACVHLLTISPMAKGLFHKAICASGVATCPWSIGLSKPENCIKLGQMLDFCDSKDPKKVVEFLRTVPAEELIRAQFYMTENVNDIPAGPVIDAKSKNPFLPRPLNELLKNDADIPMLIGYTNNEFIMFLKKNSDEDLKKMDQKMRYNIEQLAISKEPEKIERLMKDVRNHYFGNDKPISKEDIPSLINVMSDIYFCHPINNIADDRRKRKCAPTYLYKFSYVGEETTINQLLRQNEIRSENLRYYPKGASHADELSYLFYLPFCKVTNPLPPAKGTKDRDMIERLTYLWTNFAKTGNPTSSLNEYVNTTWTPVSKDTLTYLEIKDMVNCPFKDELAEMIKKHA